MAEMIKADVRQKLVDTAARLFYAQGYQATGINQIIDEADVCKASFYNHFRTKEELLVAWLERSHNEGAAKVRALLAQPLEPRELISSLFKFHEEQLCAKGYRGCPFMNSLAEAPESESRVREVARWHAASMRQMLEEVVSRATREKGLKRDQVAKLVDDMEVVILGGLTAARAAQDVRPLKHAHEMAERLLGIT